VTTLTVRTERQSQLVDITRQVEAALGELNGATAALVYVPHTTAAVTVGENWDDDVTKDVERALSAWVPDVKFDHGEGNSPAHFLSEAIGVSCLLPLAGGKPVLGRWQGIFLIELDGPRERTVRVGAIGAGGGFATGAERV